MLRPSFSADVLKHLPYQWSETWEAWEVAGQVLETHLGMTNPAHIEQKWKKWTVLLGGTGRAPSTSTLGLLRVETCSSFSLESPESCLRLEHYRHWPQGFPPLVKAATGSKQPRPGHSSAADNEPDVISSLQKNRDSSGPRIFN